MNNFSTLNGELFTIVNAEAHSNIITEFIYDSYHWCKLIVVCSKEFKIVHEKRCEICIIIIIIIIIITIIIIIIIIIIMITINLFSVDVEIVTVSIN